MFCHVNKKTSFKVPKLLANDIHPGVQLCAELSALFYFGQSLPKIFFVIWLKTTKFGVKSHNQHIVKLLSFWLWVIISYFWSIMYKCLNKLNNEPFPITHVFYPPFFGHNLHRCFKIITILQNFIISTEDPPTPPPPTPAPFNHDCRINICTEKER